MQDTPTEKITDYIDGLENTTQTIVIRGMPESVYHKTKRASQTSLKKWAISAADGIDAPPFDAETSKEATQGSAVHSLLLDGEEAFADQYIVDGPINKSTGKPYGRDSQAFKDWLAEQEKNGKTFITSTELDTVRAMADAIRRDEFVYSIITMPDSERELTIFWDEVIDGITIPCKARIDWFNQDIGITDLKSTCDAELDGFCRSVANRGWHAQSYWYPHAVVMGDLLEREPPYGWVVVQNNPPHKVKCYRPDSLMLSHGRSVAWRGLKNMARVMSGGSVYEQNTGFERVALPPFAWEEERSINQSMEEMR